jgi:hypothetical protein
VKNKACMPKPKGGERKGDILVGLEWERE